MKKLFLFAAVVAFGASMTSCKKDYTCTCTTEGGGVSVSASTTINDTKSKAQDACEGGSSTVAGITTTCAID